MVTLRLSPTLSMSSSWPRTVTVWVLFQLVGVKVRSVVAPQVRPAAGPSTWAPVALVARMVTLSRGLVSSLTV